MPQFFTAEVETVPGTARSVPKAPSQHGNRAAENRGEHQRSLPAQQREARAAPPTAGGGRRLWPCRPGHAQALPAGVRSCCENADLFRPSAVFSVHSCALLVR